MSEPDDIETRLRRHLAEEASHVAPLGDGLARIREGIERRPAHPWWGPAVVGLAAAGVVAAAVIGGINWLDGNDEPTVAAAPTPSTQPASSAPVAPSGPAVTPVPPTTAMSGATSPDLCAASTPAPVAVASTPVYRLSSVAGELRLYREFVPAAPTAGPCGALTKLFSAKPIDPDYTTTWPSGSVVEHYRVDGPAATVDLSAQAADATADATTVRLSMQQLVYTVTAQNPNVSKVRLTIGGRAVTRLWGQDVGPQPLSRAPMMDVQGRIWIIDPAQGATTGSRVTVRVFGTAFEGNVVLQVFQGTKQVEGTYVTTAMGTFAEGSTQITLPPGRYTIRAYDETGDASALVERDSKDFSVR